MIRVNLGSNQATQLIQGQKICITTAIIAKTLLDRSCGSRWGTLVLLLRYSDFTAVLPKKASSHKNQQILSFQQKMQIFF